MCGRGAFNNLLPSHFQNCSSPQKHSSYFFFPVKHRRGEKVLNFALIYLVFLSARKSVFNRRSFREQRKSRFTNNILWLGFNSTMVNFPISPCQIRLSICPSVGLIVWAASTFLPVLGTHDGNGRTTKLLRRKKSPIEAPFLPSSSSQSDPLSFFARRDQFFGPRRTMTGRSKNVVTPFDS